MIRKLLALATVGTFAVLSATAGAYAGPKDIDFSISINSDGFSFGIGKGNNYMPQPDSYACFYKNSWFGGSKTCFDAGNAKGHLNGNWDNKISSVELYGAAVVKVCTQPNFGGYCQTVKADTGKLSASVNDKISSFKVLAWKI